MRNAFLNAMLTLADSDPKLVFLTGDLGFGFLEPIRDKLGDRFINCGVAEQNMVSVAAGMASEGMNVWVYSIAPFLYMRAFEQIARDVCAHNLPVKFVGAGGGFGYGVMGQTHHAINDYGTLLTLPNMECYVPARSEEINYCVACMMDATGASYIRLGRNEFSDWNKYIQFGWHGYRKFAENAGDVAILCIGPILGAVCAHYADQIETRPAIWSLSDLIPEQHLIRELEHRYKVVLILEEHVRHGSAGESLMADNPTTNFMHMAADYITGRSGSQLWHRKQCGLSIEHIALVVEELRK